MPDLSDGIGAILQGETGWSQDHMHMEAREKTFIISTGSVCFITTSKTSSSYEWQWRLPNIQAYKWIRKVCMVQTCIVKMYSFVHKTWWIKNLVDGWMGTYFPERWVDRKWTLNMSWWIYHFLSWASSVKQSQQWLDYMCSRALCSSNILQVHYFLSSRYRWLAAQTKNGLYEGLLYLLSYRAFHSSSFSGSG